MNPIPRRLACLNLALLLLVLTAIPAGAVPAEHEISSEVSAESENTAEAKKPGEDAVPEAPLSQAATARTTMSSLRLYRNSSSSDYSYKSAKPYYISSSYPYRNYFRLGNYVFTRSDAAQAGWIKTTNATSTDLIPLNATYSVLGGATSSSLYAIWAPHRDGYVILNALFGEFSNPSVTNNRLNQQRVTYQKSGTRFPTDYLVSESGYRLLGWTSEHTPLQGTDGILSGQWYDPGDNVPSGVSTLYSYEYEYGPTGSTLVVYHAGAGTVKRGGTVLVQDAKRSSNALDASLFNAPENLVFQGWSLRPAGTQADYQAGAIVSVKSGVPTHLYAVWALNERPIASNLYASVDTGAKTVQIRAEQAYFTGNSYYGSLRAALALYQNGKLADVVMSPLGYPTDVVLKASYTGPVPTSCKFFVLNGSGQPLGPAVPFNPALLPS